MNNQEWTTLKRRRKFKNPPQEASQNLQAPELNQVKLNKKNQPDGRSLRRTHRTQQFNTKVSPEFYQLLHSLAQQEKLLMTEVLEKALQEYAQKKLKKTRIKK